MSAAQYAGSLLTKRKAELTEIASSLGLPEPEAKMADLIKSIQEHLDSNEKALTQNPVYKGLFVRRRHNEGETPGPDFRGAIDGVVKKSRKSINKLVDSIDPANIALPETPISVSKISTNAQQSVAKAQQSVSKAQQSVSKALVPAKGVSSDLTVQARRVSNQLVKYGRASQHRVDHGVGILREYLSNPEHIVASALAVELAFLFAHVLQFYDHTIFFPPPSGASGTFPSLFHGLFSWAPKFHLDLRYPDAFGLGWRADIWPAVSWWVSATVLPALAGSSVVTFARQGRATRSGQATRASPANTKPDPFTFALFRFALLLFPLTSAAPSSLVDALEMSGNLQGRALGAGLLAMLLLAERLQQ